MRLHPKVFRIAVTQEELDNFRLWLINKEMYFVGGASSLYVPKLWAKYLVTSINGRPTDVRHWFDTDGEYLLMSPGEAARTELAREFPELKRVGWSKYHARLFDWKPPIACMSPYRGEMVYTDLKSAYWQIYRRLTLDGGYPRGLGRLFLSPIADRLRDWKAARNAVIGTIRSRQAIGWRGTSPKFLKVTNPFLSPCRWATVMSILHEIAWKAISTGAIYVATDGFYHPSTHLAYWFQHWLVEDLGLQIRSEVDEAHFVCWGNYKFGQRETNLYKSGYGTFYKPVTNIKLPNCDDEDYFTNWWKGTALKWFNAMTTGS